MIEAGGSRSYKPTNDGDDIDVGTRIFHQKFGYGRVISSDGDKLDIDFEKAGQKRVMANFVSLA